MDGGRQTGILAALSQQLEERWDDIGEDRKVFFLGLRHLQEGKIDEAARVFRRAARHCDPPFAVMARMAQARCEVVRGHQGAALGLFERVAASEAPKGLRNLAWREIADLAGLRGDQELLEKARRGANLTRPHLDGA